MIVSLLLATILLNGIYVASHRISGLQLTIVLVIAGLGAAMIISPQLTSNAAALFGVGRGTDLLLYFAIMVGLFVVANFYFRFKRQEKQIIELVRCVALLEAEELVT